MNIGDSGFTTVFNASLTYSGSCASQTSIGCISDNNCTKYGSNYCCGSMQTLVSNLTTYMTLTNTNVCQPNTNMNAAIF
jgi:hypothetical protein